MTWKLELDKYGKYFTFPAGENFQEIISKGDVVVSSDSQRLQAGGMTHQYLIDKCHFGADLGILPLWSGEPEQYEKIREVLCEDALIMKTESPLSSSGKIYTTHFPLKGKIRDYLPLNCVIAVDLFDVTDNSHTFGYNITHDPNKTDNDLDLNPNYEESGDNYQAVVSKYIPLFSYKSPVDDTQFKLTLEPSDAANIKGAQQSMDFTYTCLIDTTTPSDLDVEVSTKTAITVKFKEKIRKESFITYDQDSQNYTVILKDEQGNPVSMTYVWIDNYTVKLTPQASFKENSKYTMTIKGDDPTTEDDLATPFKIDNLEGVQWYYSCA